MDNTAKDFARKILCELTHIRQAIAQLTTNAPEEYDKQPKSPERTLAEKYNAGQWQPTLAPKVTPSPSNSNQSEKPWYRSFQWWKSLFELVGILFAIGYAIVTYRQWRDLQHNFTVDQRAWIKIKIEWPSLDSSTPAIVVANLSNVGKSVVTRMYIDAPFEIVESRRAPSFSLHVFHSTREQEIMFPTDTSPFPIQLYDRERERPRAFTNEEIAGLKAGTKYLAIFGIVHYFDQFGDHWYRFCQWHPYSTIVAAAEACVAWNTVGDDPGIPPNSTMSHQRSTRQKL